MEFPKYFYFRVKTDRKGLSVELEDASDVDVAEVVRCKDCKWACTAEDSRFVYCGYRTIADTLPPYWFCADGEPKGDVPDDNKSI